MSANFLRLFRELKHIEPDTRAIDATFEKERIEVLHTLGYDVGHDLTSVSPSKHHGKAARRFAKHRRLEALARDNKVESKKMRELQSIRVKVREIKSIAQRIQECSTSAEPIPCTLWAKSDSLYEDSAASDFPRRVEHSSVVRSEHDANAANSLVSVKGRLQMSPIRQRATHATHSTHADRRSPRVFHKDHSDNKWTEEERARLNTIYHALSRPRDRNATAWDGYFQELARRFRAFHPSRSPTDIRVKALEMIRLRQMKEPGESDYWRRADRGTVTGTSTGTGTGTATGTSTGSAPRGGIASLGAARASSSGLR